MSIMRTIKGRSLSDLVPFAMFFSLCAFSSHAVDTIRPKETVTNDETLVSAGGVFELGFFSDEVSGNHYMGIWFKDDKNKRAVWVANRESPILDSSGILQIRYDGNLILIDRRQTPVIVNSGMLATSANTSATLLDSGNLILKEGDKIIWQSFDYPTDTYLSGMKLGWFGLNTDQRRMQVLVSWMSPTDPTRGAFTLGTYGVENNSFSRLVVWEGSSVHMDIGFWDGQNFRFIFANSSNTYNFNYVANENDTYFIFSTKGGYDSTWFVMAPTGQIDEFTMSKGKISMASHLLCEEDSAMRNKTTRCFTSMPSMCKDGDYFSKISGSMPTSLMVNNSVSMSFRDCQITCGSNCSCTAFVSAQDNRMGGCQLYYGNKYDLLDIIEKGGGIIYIRGAAARGGGEKKRKLWLIIISSLLVPILLVSLFCYLHWRKRFKGTQVRSPADISGSADVRLFQLDANLSPVDEVRSANKLELVRQKDQELPLFSFSTIEAATNYFAAANKLGEGGFGPVYKGELLQGQEIAVKRLSKLSRQGLEEFKNELTLISKLQHRNLVRLLGCCTEAEESILIYEYMPNKSLDSFIFDSNKSVLLDWRTRVNIIEGIAQGLLYLHKYSRLRIIHRDLKTSNILLDHHMKPKISDFGMARIFEEDDTRLKTRRVVGTYGYMSPEYAMDGIFSEKSDVFSFGVIVLEIVSGKKNIAFFETDHSLNLPGNAWNLWKEGKSMELLDSTVADSCSRNEVLRCVQLGLLCVQERAIDRPTMSDVVSMLSSAISLPLPKEPAFLTQIRATYAESSPSRQRQSINDITISEIYAR